MLNDHCWTWIVATIWKLKKSPFPWICESNFKYSPSGQNETSEVSLRECTGESWKAAFHLWEMLFQHTAESVMYLVIWLPLVPVYVWGRCALNPTFSPFTDTSWSKAAVPPSRQRVHCRRGGFSGVHHNSDAEPGTAWSVVGEVGQLSGLGLSPPHSATAGYNKMW